jgi:hypothetical protein
MKSLNSLLIGMALAITLACTNTKAPDVTDNIRHALDSAGLSDVRVTQDRDKNVVTLSGNVATHDEKTHAESIAKAQAGSAVRGGRDRSTAEG